jgi:phosphatidate cytidylyltransferase
VGKSNLAVRLTTAGLVAPLLLVVLFLAPAWAWYIVVFVACGIAAQELFAMTHPGDAIAQAVGVVSTLAVSAAVYFRSSDPRVLLSVLVLLPVVAVMVPLWRLGEIQSAGLRIAAGVAGPLYIGMLLTTIGLLRRDQAASGPGFVLFSLMIAWLGDTGGYFFGRFLGKTKLYAAVSPKKTRAGFVGSLVGSSVGALLAHFWYLKSLPLADAIVLAVVAGALGQLGDLVESLLKRSTGVKDSGWIIPGHGGILDRIDALLIVSGIVYLYTLWAPAIGI